MIVDVLQKLVEGRSLTEGEARDVMADLMDGNLTNTQIGAMLAALRLKGETAEEMTGFAKTMREHSIRVYAKHHPLLDTCGTGGDVCSTFNISTAAAFVVAASGVGIAKHGNRAVSSKCGSADVLISLGVNIDIQPLKVAQSIDEVGIGFLFAPAHHPAMKYANVPRKELGIRTVFNALGPMTNPANAERQIIGVFHPDFCEKMAKSLMLLGCERAMIVHGLIGMDEISTCGPTLISNLKDGRIWTETLQPEDFGVKRARIEDLNGGETPQENAEILRDVLSCVRGPKYDIVCVNAAAGLIICDKAKDWRDGVELARRLIASGEAMKVLDTLVAFTNKPFDG